MHLVNLSKLLLFADHNGAEESPMLISVERRMGITGILFMIHGTTRLID